MWLPRRALAYYIVICVYIIARDGWLTENGMSLFPEEKANYGDMLHVTNFHYYKGLQTKPY